MTRRTALRIAALAGGLATPLLLAAPAYALDDGEVPSSLGLGMTILLFVVIPVGVCLLVALLCVAPDLLRRPRYRPGRPWGYEPLWFAGPDDPDEALSGARAGATAKGGTSAGW